MPALRSCWRIIRRLGGHPRWRGWRHRELRGWPRRSWT